MSGSDGASGADNSSSRSNDTRSADQAADALSDVKDAISDALGQVADALGLDSMADALGLDALQLDNVFGAALMGAITGGLPGAIMGAINALTGGSLVSSARAAIDQLPEPLQPFANMAVDRFAGQVPGLNAGLNPQAAIAEFASGALTNGRVPSMEDVAAVVRDWAGVNNAATGLMEQALSGDLSVDDVAGVMDDVLGVSFNEAHAVVSDVVSAVEAGNGVFANSGYSDFGNAVERLAVSVSGVMTQR